MVSLTIKPCLDVHVLFFSTARVRTSQKEIHDYSMIISPALDRQMPSFLILVSTSSAPFLLITGLLWVPWHAEHGFAKPHSNPPPTFQHTQTQPTDYFSQFFPYDDAHTISTISSLDRDVHLAQSHRLATFFFSLEWHIQIPPDIWLWVNFVTFLR